ncbi:hypothetical protein BB558_005605 [Smittium angustum]|uniref:Sugar phosphate transporter domain-containing protein n=1 Tax=Smittium angustum TaxID=133377 RepID=A0A2U1IZZ0_SMIAN|nr:hypothetical protein BB558_005605 [Smittium angustum]
MMILSEFFLISQTSIVTLAVAGIVKEVLTILLSTLTFGDKLTVENVIGLIITLIGIGFYNYLKVKGSVGVPKKETYTQIRNNESSGTSEYNENADILNHEMSDNITHRATNSMDAGFMQNSLLFGAPSPNLGSDSRTSHDNIEMETIKKM